MAKPTIAECLQRIEELEARMSFLESQHSTASKVVIRPPRRSSTGVMFYPNTGKHACAICQALPGDWHRASCRNNKG